MAVTALVVAIGLVATSGARPGAAELSTGAAASRSLSEGDAAEAADAGLLPAVTVPPTTAAVRTPPTTARPAAPVTAPSTPLPLPTTAPTTVAPTTTTTTNPCFTNPAAADVTLVNDFAQAVMVALNDFVIIVAGGERRDVKVYPGACADEVVVRQMALPGMPCEMERPTQRSRFFQPGGFYVVTVVADPAGCMGLPIPKLLIKPA